MVRDPHSATSFPQDPLPRHALELKKRQEGVPPPPWVQTPRLPPPPPPLSSHLKKFLISALGAPVLCVSQGRVQGVSQLFILNACLYGNGPS